MRKNRQQRRQEGRQTGWQPFELAKTIEISAEEVEGRVAAARLGLPQVPEEEIRAALATVQNSEIWRNNLYQISRAHVLSMRQGFPDFYVLGIRRLDGGNPDDIPWAHLQQTKNEIIGPACEGVELYPAFERDLAEKVYRYLWVVADPQFRWPFGQWPEKSLLERAAGEAIDGTEKAELIVATNLARPEGQKM
jgi:hypothetical protein